MPSNGHAPANVGAVLALHRRDSAAPLEPPAAADAAPPDETPLEYMLRVMRDPNADQRRRDDMAKAAARYLHPRPPAPKQDESARSEQEAADVRRTLAERFARFVDAEPVAPRGDSGPLD